MKSALFKWACIAILSLSPVQQVSGIRGGQPVADASEGSIRALSRVVVAIKKYADDGVLRHVCTGTLISPDRVLTAAHCFDDKDYTIHVQSGANVLPYSRIGIHREYQRHEIRDDYWDVLYDIKLSNDYALIWLSTAVSPDLELIRNDFSALATGAQQMSNLFVMGYGQTANIFGIGRGQGVLRYSGPLVGTALSAFRTEIRDNAKGGCLGDSGGPLFNIEQGRITLLGIMSQGDCNTFSRYQSVLPPVLNADQYLWTDPVQLQEDWVGYSPHNSRLSAE